MSNLNEGRFFEQLFPRHLRASAAQGLPSPPMNLGTWDLGFRGLGVQGLDV